MNASRLIFLVLAGGIIYFMVYMFKNHPDEQGKVSQQRTSPTRSDASRPPKIPTKSVKRPPRQKPIEVKRETLAPPKVEKSELQDPDEVTDVEEPETPEPKVESENENENKDKETQEETKDPEENTTKELPEERAEDPIDAYKRILNERPEGVMDYDYSQEMIQKLSEANRLDLADKAYDLYKEQNEGHDSSCLLLIIEQSREEPDANLIDHLSESCEQESDM